MKKAFANSAIICIILVSAFSVWLAGNLGGFGLNKIVFDVVSYHSYVPATFIKKDLSLQFYKDSAEYYNKQGMYWANFTKDGKPVIKTTCGLSLMYLPFTIWPIVFKGSEIVSGYELPFSIAITTSNLFYYILSLFILFKLLKALQFSDLAIGFTVLSLGLGTNLLSYASISLGMPHAYDFFLISSLLYLSLLWHQQPKLYRSLLIGLVMGLLILIRPTNMIFILCFFLFQKKEDTYSVKKYLINWKHLFVIGLMAFIVVLPQLLYWHYVTGQYFYNSYINERFYFNHPHLLEYLVGFRKGWFIYSPLILMGLWGLFYSKNSNPFLRATLIIIPLLVFLNSSWWCWWFGGGHGARAMIETYPLIAIGFAAFFEKFFVLKKKLVITFTVFFIAFNIKSVDLYRANIIHYDSMTYKAFVYGTFKIIFSDEDKNYLKTLYQPPDYQRALEGK